MGASMDMLKMLEDLINETAKHSGFFKVVFDPFIHRYRIILNKEKKI